MDLERGNTRNCIKTLTAMIVGLFSAITRLLTPLRTKVTPQNVERLSWSPRSLRNFCRDYHLKLNGNRYRNSLVIGRYDARTFWGYGPNRKSQEASIFFFEKKRRSSSYPHHPIRITRCNHHGGSLLDVCPRFGEMKISFRPWKKLKTTQGSPGKRRKKDARRWPESSKSTIFLFLVCIEASITLTWERCPDQ